MSLQSTYTSRKQLLASNLATQGVTGYSSNDGLTTLINAVLDIQTGGGSSDIIYKDTAEYDQSEYYQVTGALTSTSLSINWDKQTDYYEVYGSGGDQFAFFTLPGAKGMDNVRISLDVYLATSSAYNQNMIGLTDTLANSSPTNAVFDAFRIRGDNKRDYLHNSDQEVSGSSSTVSVRNTWIRQVIERKGTNINCYLYNENNTLLSSYNYTTNNTYSEPYYFVGMNCRYATNIKRLKNIIVEEI